MAYEKVREAGAESIHEDDLTRILSETSTTRAPTITVSHIQDYPRFFGAIFDQFFLQLTHAVQNHMSSGLRKRIDPTDIVQRAFADLWEKNRKITVSNRAQLWTYLLRVCINTLLQYVEEFSAQKRDMNRDTSLEGLVSADVNFDIEQTTEPTAMEMAIQQEVHDQVVARVDSDTATMFEDRIHGFMVREIAIRSHVAERTVRRRLNHVKALLRDVSEA